jgi:hypothetical protein
MGQRSEHLPAANLFATLVVLHHRVAAREAMLVPEPIEGPLGRVPLLGRPLLASASMASITPATDPTWAA